MLATEGPGWEGFSVTVCRLQLVDQGDSLRCAAEMQWFSDFGAIPMGCSSHYERDAFEQY
jgi:hypothetical protein